MVYNARIAWLNSQLSAIQSLLESTKDNILMRASLENRIADLKEQIAAAEKVDIVDEAAKLDVWFTGKGVYGSQGISSVFMKDTMQALVGMIQSTTREKVRRLKEDHRKAEMPKGQFYVTALTQGSFGYELTYKDADGQLCDDPAIVESIRSTIGVIEEATSTGLNVDEMIQEQPIRLVSNLKDLFTSLKRHGSTIRIESGSAGVSLDTNRVSKGYDNFCLSDIIEKPEEIPAVFQGAFIESGKFEFTDAEGKLQHGNISEDLSNDAIAQLNRDFSRRECKLQIIRRIVSYSSGRKKENVELMGIIQA